MLYMFKSGMYRFFLSVDHRGSWHNGLVSNVPCSSLEECTVFIKAVKIESRQSRVSTLSTHKTRDLHTGILCIRRIKNNLKKDRSLCTHVFSWLS